MALGEEAVPVGVRDPVKGLSPPLVQLPLVPPPVCAVPESEGPLVSRELEAPVEEVRVAGAAEALRLQSTGLRRHCLKA